MKLMALGFHAKELVILKKNGKFIQSLFDLIFHWTVILQKSFFYLEKEKFTAKQCIYILDYI